MHMHRNTCHVICAQQFMYIQQNAVMFLRHTTTHTHAAHRARTVECRGMTSNGINGFHLLMRTVP